jgi:predicted Zn-dependent peptidase
MYKQSKLKNGLTLITAPVKGTKTVTILVTIGTGAKYENKQNNGISHFLEHLFFKGTKKRPTPFAVASDADAIGGEFNAYTSKESTSYYMKVDSSKTEQAVEMLADMLTNSLFNTEELEREKGVIIEEINMYLDNPMMNIEDVFEKLMYGDTAAGRPTQGIRETVSGIGRDNILNYFNKQYQLKNTLVIAAGDINAKTIKLIEKYFGEFAKSHNHSSFQNKDRVAVKQQQARLKTEFKQTDQAHLSLGVHTYPYGHKKQAALKILGIILGGSMSARLFMELREKRGLAYYVRTEIEPYTDCGYLTSRAGVPVAKVEEAIKVILDEYSKLKKELVSKTELQRIKDMIRGKITIQLEASDDVANWYSRQAVMDLTQVREGMRAAGIDTPEQFFREIAKVTPAEIRAVAREIFVPEKLNLAVIGPFKDGRNFEKLLKF